MNDLARQVEHHKATFSISEEQAPGEHAHLPSLGRLQLLEHFTSSPLNTGGTYPLTYSAIENGWPELESARRLII